MNMPKLTLLTVTVGLLSAAGPTAFAEESPVFSATLCHPTTSTDAARLLYSPAGVQNNSTAGSASITCGSARESAGSDNLLQVLALAYDRSSTADVCCTLSAQDAFGATVWSAADCSSGNSGNIKIFLEEAPEIPFTNTTVQCTIPARTSSGNSSLILHGFVTVE